MQNFLELQYHQNSVQNPAFHFTSGVVLPVVFPESDDKPYHHPLKGGEGKHVTVHFNVCKTSLWKIEKIKKDVPHRSPSIF